MSDLLTTYTQKPLADFYDWIIPDIPGYIGGLVDQALRGAAIELCRKSRQWRTTIDAITVQAGEPSYEMDVPEDALVFEVEVAKLSGEELTPETEQDLKAEIVDWDVQDGTPKHFLLYDQNVIRLVPIPDATVNAGLYLEAALQPTATAAKLPSFLLERYVETLAKGAKARLMLMQKKPWTNPDLGMALNAEFGLEVSRLGWRRAAGHARAPLRVRTVHK